MADTEDAQLRLRYLAAHDDDKLITHGGFLFAATFAGFVYFAISALTEGVHDVAFARDVGWSVFLGLVALFAGTRVYVRWRRQRTGRQLPIANPATARVVPRDRRR